MNERINLPDIADLLVEKHEMEKRDAELFIRDMFELIEESLATEKYVKIKGLGTFKLTEVDARESVDVNTGERIEIQGHTKVSFTPDTTMKELVNKPFSHFETVVLNDGVELDDYMEMEVPVDETENTAVEESVQEEVPIPVSNEEFVVVEEVVEEVIPESQKEVVEEVYSSMESSVMEEVKEPEELACTELVDEVEEVDAQIPEITEKVETVVKEEPVVAEEPRHGVDWGAETSQHKEKNIIRILWGVIAVLLLIILFGCYWLFIRPTSSPEESVVPNVQEVNQGMVIDSVQEVAEKKTLPVGEGVDVDTMISDVQVTTFQAPKDNRIAALADTLEYRIVGTKAIYTLQSGESIIKASVKFYGSKMFWPYIVKHNRDVIKNADNIPAGAEIKIPELVPNN